MNVDNKIAELRCLMNKYSLDAYLIGNNDYHSSEYVNNYYKERSFMSGFDGSNGLLLVLKDSSYLWTDGRYFLQAEKDLNNTEIKLMKMATVGYPSLTEFINQNLKGKRLGLNGKTFSYGFVKSIESVLTVVSNLDLVNEIWINRGSLNTNSIYELPIDLVGEDRISKLTRIREKIKEDDVDSILITNIDDIAWTYNLRGSDVDITPVFLSFSYITLDNAYLFLNKKVLEHDALVSLETDNVSVLEYDSFINYLKDIKNKKILVSYNSTNYSFINVLVSNNELINKVSPIQLFKSIKNDTEIKNNIDVHKADGLAVFRFMKYVKENHKKVSMDEYMLTEKILEFRKMDKRFYEVSFETIAGWNANGAIVHYEPTKDNYSKIENDGFLLVDSGGQYKGGTTDITRTYQLGEVSDEMKFGYTLTLKAHIDVAMAKFIKGTTGENIDMLSRVNYWKYGLDYKHGTGHGIGYMLNVHEGPQSIRYHHSPSSAQFVPGMITSNEPGIYIENKYGVRIENEVLCVLDKKDDINEFYKFDTITFAPIDLDPVIKEMLTKEEVDWLNNYHNNVYQVLSKLCNDDELDYLKFVTRNI